MDAKEMMGLDGKIAVVLGGGQGNGEATCLRLAAAGAHVAVVDLDIQRAKKVAAAVEAMGRKSCALTGDLREPGVAQAIFDDVTAKIGVPDKMITIIGQATFKPIIDMTPEEWDRDFSINVRFYFLAAQAFARTLIAAGKGGTIASIASLDGVQGAPVHAAYGSAKAAMIHLVKTLAIELADHGIRVNCVAAGSIVTPRVPQSDARKQQMHDSMVPLRRSGEAHEVANALIFLSSDLSSYMTGQALNVDGGWSITNLFNAARASTGNVVSADGSMGEKF